MTLDDQVRECSECHMAYSAMTLRHLYVVRKMLAFGWPEEMADTFVQVMKEAALRDYRLMYGRAPRGVCPKCLPVVQARQDARYCPEGA